MGKIFFDKAGNHLSHDFHLSIQARKQTFTITTIFMNMGRLPGLQF